MNTIWIDCKYNKDDWSLAASMMRRLMAYFEGNVQGREASAVIDWRYNSIYDLKKAADESPLVLVEAFTWPRDSLKEELLFEIIEGCVRRGHFMILLASGKCPKSLIESGDIVYLREMIPRSF